MNEKLKSSQEILIRLIKNALYDAYLIGRIDAIEEMKSLREAMKSVGKSKEE